MPRKAISPMSQPIFHEPTFNEGTPTPDPSGFVQPHPSDDKLYDEIEDILDKNVVSFDKSRVADGEMLELQAVYGDPGAQVIQQITAAGKIVFHAVGDSGASSAKKYDNELSVADQVTQDAQSAQDANRIAFLFHLGDVVYDFGESKYYYDQFYEPFRDYPGPILAIPGNHDSFIVPASDAGAPGGEDPLTIFARNFCAESPVITPEAASLHRTAMTQPGVYFTLDAPFVRIIGLFSNSLEGPGVIAPEDKKYATVPDYQLSYLSAQLKQIKAQDYKGAVIIAVHHPPFSYSPKADSTSSAPMLRQIDQICQNEGVYPHAFLSGHAHNYQRYTRSVTFDGREYDVPFIVCGDGGHNVNKLTEAKKGQPSQEPDNGADVSYLDPKPAVTATGLLLEKYDDIHYGYLRISVDKEQLRIGFHQVGQSTLAQSRYDMVTVDLASHTMVSN